MRKVLFFIAISIATIIYTLQQLQWPIPQWINNYVNDFLILPLVLSICLVVVRKLKGDATLLLSLPLILAVTLFYCIYFEWYLPQHHPRYTGDWVDCLLYFSGSFLFYVLHNLTSRKIK